MTIAETMLAKTPPLQQDDTGTIRVGGTRVTLATLVHAYQAGASAEEIALAYDCLKLADVHEVIGYYLRNRDTVDRYLGEERQQAAEARRQFPPREAWTEIRQRLLARQQQPRLMLATNCC
jgi:uncharacterized protein (DUF433 family)